MSKPNENTSQQGGAQQSQPPQEPQTAPGVIITTKPNGIVITNYVNEED